MGQPRIADAAALLSHVRAGGNITIAFGTAAAPIKTSGPTGPGATDPAPGTVMAPMYDSTMPPIPTSQPKFSALARFSAWTMSVPSVDGLGAGHELAHTEGEPPPAGPVGNGDQPGGGNSP